MIKLTLYRNDTTAQIIYENVKTFFWLNNNTVLCISIYSNTVTDEHYYIHWLREHFVWFREERY